MPQTKNKETASSFILKVLNGTTVAIVVALIPNAILATFFRPFAESNEIISYLLSIVQIFQFFTAIMAGFLIALQFNFNAIQAACVGGAAFVGSGAWKIVETKVDGQIVGIFQLAGIGDVINVMLVSSLAVLAIKFIGDKFGSLNLVLLPIIVGAGIGYIGTLTLPYVSMITSLIGQGISSFTSLQPVLMTILIAISFAIITISPISTVAIGLAVGLNGISSAAAGMGVAAAAAYLVWATMKVNDAGVPLAIGLGGMKMMMPNFLMHPIIALPVSVTAAISALSVPILNMTGAPESAGFGFVGLVSPLEAYNAGSVGLLMMFVTWIVIPFVVGFIVHKVFCKMLKLYDEEIFVFEEN
ncbi:MAG: PTS sugar transporter subunit IIC [Anaerococcus sp.]